MITIEMSLRAEKLASGKSESQNIVKTSKISKESQFSPLSSTRLITRKGGISSPEKN